MRYSFFCEEHGYLMSFEVLIDYNKPLCRYCKRLLSVNEVNEKKKEYKTIIYPENYPCSFEQLNSHDISMMGESSLSKIWDNPEE